MYFSGFQALEVPNCPSSFVPNWPCQSVSIRLMTVSERLKAVAKQWTLSNFNAKRDQRSETFAKSRSRFKNQRITVCVTLVIDMTKQFGTIPFQEQPNPLVILGLIFKILKMCCVMQVHVMFFFLRI